MIVLNTIMLESELPGTIFRSLSFPQSQSPPPPMEKLGSFTGELDFVGVTSAHRAIKEYVCRPPPKSVPVHVPE